MCWQPIGHNNDPMIKCVILLLKLELVEVSTHMHLYAKLIYLI